MHEQAYAHDKYLKDSQIFQLFSIFLLQIIRKRAINVHKPGIPNILIVKILIMFMGISIFIDDKSKFNPYKVNIAIMTLFVTFNSNLSILYPHSNTMLLNGIYDIFLRSASALSRVKISRYSISAPIGIPYDNLDIVTFLFSNIFFM